MSPKTKALLWESAARTRKDFLVRLAIAIAIATVISVLLSSWSERGSAEHAVLKACALLVLVEVSVASRVWWHSVDPESESPLRQAFIRPVSTVQLIAIPMLLASLSAAICQLASGSIIAITVDNRFPVVSSTLLAAAFSSLLVAGACTFSTLIGRILGVAVAVATIIGSFALFFECAPGQSPFLVRLGSGEFFTSSAIPWLFIAACIPTGLVIAMAGVGRQRAGESHWFESAFQHAWEWIISRLSHRSHVETQALRPAFRSKLAAQLWYEFRFSKQRVLIAIGVVCLSATAASFTSLWLAPSNGLDVRIWSAALIFSPMLIGLLATDGAAGIQSNQSAASLSQFAATRSVTCSWSQLLKLSAVSLITFASWTFSAVIAAGYFTLVGWARVTEVLQPLGEFTGFDFIAIVATAAAASVTLAILVLQLAYWMALYPKAWCAIALLGYGHGMLVFVMVTKNWKQVGVLQMYFTVLAIALGVVGLLSMLYSIRSHMTSWRYAFAGTVIVALDLLLLSRLSSSRFIGLIPQSWALPEPIAGFPYAAGLLVVAAIFSLPVVFGRLRHT